MGSCNPGAFAVVRQFDSLIRPRTDFGNAIDAIKSCIPNPRQLVTVTVDAQHQFQRKYLLYIMDVMT